MPTKFSEFFTLGSDADDFQKRLYAAISDATTIVNCYFRIYEYIVGGVKWVSKKARHDLMDNTVDSTGFNPDQLNDAQLYFGELTDLGTSVLFEYLDMTLQDIKYGPNVYSLAFNTANPPLAQTAIRQVQLYRQVQIYNEEYKRQADYHNTNPNSTQPLPNGQITIDPTVPNERVNPDNQSQINLLTNFVDDLVTWIKNNYPILLAVIHAKPDDLFPFVFVSGHLDYEQKIDALETMLDKVRCMGDSKPASTHKAFGNFVITQLEAHKDFWDNTKISDEYADIMKLKRQFAANARRNLEIFQYFDSLFADFLDPDRYEGETEFEAETRRTTALGYIQSIFVTFSNSQVDPIRRTFDNMMARALQRIQADYESLYTNNLLRAKAPIPANNAIKTILPNYLADLVKEKADECLRTLPLMQGKTEVRFFIIQNFEDLQALNDKSVTVTKANEKKSFVTVRPDPTENKVDVYRPIYRSIRYSTTVDRYIAFCNLPNLAAGTFFYRPVQSPAVVKVPTRDGKRILTIDFQNYTIMYEGKKEGPFKNDAGEPYRSMGRTVNFYTELKNTTKWREISAVRRYDPYYTTDPANAAKPVAHLTGYVAAGRGATRVLPLGDESLCLWLWNSSGPSRASYPKLGEVIGLPPAREISPMGPAGLAQLQVLRTACSVLIGGKQYTFVNYGPQRFRTEGFYYPVIGITRPGKEELFYVQVNTPTLGVAAVLTGVKQPTKGRGSRPLADTPQTILDLFNFSYFRRITSITNAFSGAIDFTDSSKVYQLFRKGDKRMPTGPGTEEINWPDTEFDAIGANLPICFNVKDNIIQYFLDKQRRGKIINKGNSLFREQKPRKDAGTAMGAIYRRLRPPVSTALSSSKVPATAFAKGAMRESPAVQSDWGVLKVASSNLLPINQEWCHLRGHGDGGEEYPGNFVSGSYHCNTEQLAIETGQRVVTQQSAEHTFALHTTAYLLLDATNYKSKVDADRKSQILNANYLNDQTTFQEMLKNNIARRSRELNASDGPPTKKRKVDDDMPVESSTLTQGDVAPLAAYLRYKVMKRVTKGQGAFKRAAPDDMVLVKSFDFIFEGQSEFIDKNQFALISQAVQFSLAGLDAFNNWYEQEAAELAQNAKK